MSTQIIPALLRRPTFFPPLGPTNVSPPFTPKRWDRGVLADKVLPGISRITRGGVKVKVDKKPKAGADGANPTCHGLDPQPIELEVTTFSDADRETLAEIVVGIVPTIGKKQQPVSIDHPSLRVLGITSVLILEASPLIIVGPQKTKMTFGLLHWLPTTAASATTTPKGAPVRKINNVFLNANPSPTKQPGFGTPPLSLRP